MVDQTQAEIMQIQSENKAKVYNKKKIINFRDAQDIYKQSNELNNISELDMNKFRKIMLGNI